MSVSLPGYTLMGCLSNHNPTAARISIEIRSIPDWKEMFRIKIINKHVT